MGKSILETSKRMTELGYRPRAPGQQADSIDRQVCREQICPMCGHKGLDYIPFSKGNSYRPFMVCPECDWCAEF